MESKPKAIILVGPPGSGKSHYAKKQKGYEIISRNYVEEKMFGVRHNVDEDDMIKIIKAFNHFMNESVQAKKNVILDSLHCSQIVLGQHLSFLINNGYEVEIIAFYVPKWLCHLREIWCFISKGERYSPVYINRAYNKFLNLIGSLPENCLI